MDFIKKTLNQMNVQENTLYNIIYDLFKKLIDENLNFSISLVLKYL